MGLWTRVRLPPIPLKLKRSNTVQIRNIAVYKSAFGIVLDTSRYDAGKEPDSGGIRTVKEKLVLEAFKALGVV